MPITADSGVQIRTVFSNCCFLYVFGCTLVYLRDRFVVPVTTIVVQFCVHACYHNYNGKTIEEPWSPKLILWKEQVRNIKRFRLLIYMQLIRFATSNLPLMGRAGAVTREASCTGPAAENIMDACMMWDDNVFQSFRNPGRPYCYEVCKLTLLLKS